MGNLIDNAVALGLAAATFGTSYHTIASFLSHYGFHGAVQYVGAGCPDVLFFVGVREYLRDRRTNRPHKGWVSYPTLVCGIGLFETLTLNYMGITRDGPGGFWNSALAFLVSGAMILVFMIFHRRDSHHKITKQAGTEPGSVPQGWLIPDGVSVAPAAIEWVSAAPVSGPGVSPDAIPEPPVSPETPIPEPIPEPDGNWLEVINGSGESGPESDSAPGEGPDGEGEARKGWNLDELTEYVREIWPTSQRDLRTRLTTHPRGGAAQKTVCDAIRTVRREKEAGQAHRRAVND
jgi:hypothetical protein